MLLHTIQFNLDSFDSVNLTQTHLVGIHSDSVDHKMPVEHLICLRKSPDCIKSPTLLQSLKHVVAVESKESVKQNQLSALMGLCLDQLGLRKQDNDTEKHRAPCVHFLTCGNRMVEFACSHKHPFVWDVWKPSLIFIVHRRTSPAPYSCPPQGEVVLAVAQFVSSLYGSAEEDSGLVPHSLNVSSSQRELLKKGICSYLLPGLQDDELVDISVPPSAFEKYVSPEILKVCYD